MRLTASDASFLYFETASGPMHISSVNVIDGELSFDEVYQHFADRLHLVPAYRRKLAPVPMSIAHPQWVDDPDFDLANHVIDHELPEGSSLEDGIAAAVKLNEPLMDRARPLWYAYVIRGVPGKTLMLHGTHHCMIDGASGVELMAIIYDFVAEGENVPAPKAPWEPERVPPPATLFNDALAENMQALARTNWTQTLMPSSGRQAMMQRASRIMADFVTRPVVTAPFNAGLISQNRDLAWMGQSFGEIREIRRALGGTVNDVVLAVVTSAVADYLAAEGVDTDNQYMRVMCPVNVRTENQKGSLGNRVSAIFPVLPAWQMPLTQRLAAVVSEVERIKQNQDAQALASMQETQPQPWPVALWANQLVSTPLDPTAMAAAMPPLRLPPGVRPPHIGYNFTCTNVPGPQVPQYLCGKLVDHQIGLMVCNGNVGFNIAILSYNNTVYFNFICDPTLLSNVDFIRERAAAAFEDLLTTARERTAALRA